MSNKAGEAPQWEDPYTECRHCGEEVDVTEPGHYKSVSDGFWHEDCFAEYCYERRSLVATPEGSFKIKPVIIREVEDGKEKVLDSFWRADCPVCYRTHESEEKTEEVRTDFIDQVTDCCDTEWMPPADWMEDCDICGDDHRESEGCTPLAWREPFPSAEDHRYDCTVCDWSGEADDFDNHRGECPDCGTTAVRAVRVATDGGVRNVASAKAEDQSLREWILGRIEEHIDLEDPSDQKNPWSSKDHVRQDIQFGEFGKEEVLGEINHMIDRGQLVSWHGFIAPNREEVLRAIIEAEREADVTRKILIGKCNELLQEGSADGE